MKKKMLFVMATIAAFALFVPSVMAATVSTEEELINAVNAGGDVKLGANLDLSKILKVPAGVEVVLDLNNKTLTLPTDAETTAAIGYAYYGIDVRGKLTINGNGTVEIPGGYGLQSYGTGSEITINGGTYNQNHEDAVYLLFSYTDLNVNGGVFNAKYSAVNSYKGTLNITGGNFASDEPETILVNTGVTANITGGTYDKDVTTCEYENEAKEIVYCMTGTNEKYTGALIETADGWKGAIQVGDKNYTTIAAAVDAVPVNSDTVTTVKLLDNVTAYEGIMTVASKPKNITFDLNGKTLTFAEGALVGSSGTVSQNIHVEKGSVIVFKNGKMVASKDSRMFLQNYCDLTLLDVSIDTTGVTTTNKYYAVSLNQGTINITGNTSIKSKSVAFDAYWWPDFGYTGGALVTVNTTGTIEGIIEVDASKNPEESKTILKIENINHTGEFNVLKDELKDNVSISGGTYSANVDAYVVDGKYAEKVGTIYEVKDYTVVPDVTPIDPEEEVEETTVGLTENEETAETLEESVENAELNEGVDLENTNAVVVVDVASVEKDSLDEEVLAKIEELAKKAIIANYFDIKVLVNDAKDNKNLGYIPELTKEIELMVVLPEELVNTDEKVNRKYYIIREHDGKVEVLEDVTVSEDRKSIVFKSDKFSTYALAYEDEVFEEETPKTPEKTETPENPPKTSDINLALLIGTIMLGVVGTVLVSKKRFSKNH